MLTDKRCVEKVDRSSQFASGYQFAHPLQTVAIPLSYLGPIDIRAGLAIFLIRHLDGLQFGVVAGTAR